MSFLPAKPFDDDYKEQCFQAWLMAGCPSVSKTQAILPDGPDHRRPSKDTIQSWVDGLGWRERAADINAQALLRVNEALVRSKAELLQEQLENAVAIQKKALENILEQGFDNSNAAVQAYFKASQESRVVMGLAEFVERVGQMTNEEIKAAIREEIDRIDVVDSIPLDEETDQVENKSNDGEHMNADTQSP